MAVIDTARKEELKALIISYMEAQFGPSNTPTNLAKFADAIASAIQEWNENP